MGKEDESRNISSKEAALCIENLITSLFNK